MESYNPIIRVRGDDQSQRLYDRTFDSPGDSLVIAVNQLAHLSGASRSPGYGTMKILFVHGSFTLLPDV